MDVIAETWQNSTNNLSLRSSAPPDYTAVDVVLASDPEHGGIAMLRHGHSSVADGESFCLISNDLAQLAPSACSTLNCSLSTVLESLVAL